MYFPIVSFIPNSFSPLINSLVSVQTIEMSHYCPIENRQKSELNYENSIMSCVCWLNDIYMLRCYIHIVVAFIPKIMFGICPSISFITVYIIRVSIQSISSIRCDGQIIESNIATLYRGKNSICIGKIYAEKIHSCALKILNINSIAWNKHSKNGLWMWNAWKWSYRQKRQRMRLCLFVTPITTNWFVWTFLPFEHS